MDAETFRTIQKIHRSPYKAVIATTGGGTGAFPLLMERGNASRTVISGHIPYDLEEHIEYLGRRPDKFVDAVDSRMLALTSYQRATKRCPLHAVGIGATASLQKLDLEDDLVTYKPERDKRRHEIHVSMHMIDETATWSLVSEGPIRQPEAMTPMDAGQACLQARLWEEQTNSLMIIKALAYACGENLENYYDTEFDFRSVKASDIHPFMGTLIQRQVPYLIMRAGDGEVKHEPRSSCVPGLIISGSFNPIHIGHESMAQTAAARIGQYPHYEMPISNPDKGWLDYIAIRDRLDYFHKIKDPAFVLLTNAPTFLEKSRIFPKCTFAVGMDTFVRIIDPKYVPLMSVDELAAQFALNQTKFLVFGRRDRQTGKFIDSPEEIAVNLGIVTPKSFLDFSIFVPEAEFSVDMASSDIRKGGGA